MIGISFVLIEIIIGSPREFDDCNENDCGLFREPVSIQAIYVLDYVNLIQIKMNPYHYQQQQHVHKLLPIKMKYTNWCTLRIWYCRVYFAVLDILRQIHRATFILSIIALLLNSKVRETFNDIFGYELSTVNAGCGCILCTFGINDRISPLSIICSFNKSPNTIIIFVMNHKVDKEKKQVVDQV